MTKDIELPTHIFMVHGLYGPPRHYSVATEAAARRAYHDEFPGFEGTILAVKASSSLTGTLEMVADNVRRYFDKKDV